MKDEEEEEKDDKAAPELVVARVTTVVPLGPTPVLPQTILTLSAHAATRARGYVIKAVYFFERDAVDTCCDGKWKDAMSEVLRDMRDVAGRLRRLPRPHIKCNDGGVRVLEVISPFTLSYSLLPATAAHPQSLATSSECLFLESAHHTPLVTLQLTSFRCGGLAVGLSWSLILGDVQRASEFMSRWATNYRRRQSQSQSQSECSLVCTMHRRSRHQSTGCADVGVLSYYESLSRHLLHPIVVQGGVEAGCRSEWFALPSKAVEYVTREGGRGRPFAGIAAFLWKCVGAASVLLCENRRRGVEGGDPRWVRVKMSREEMNAVSLEKIAERIECGGIELEDGDDGDCSCANELTFVDWEAFGCDGSADEMCFEERKRARRICYWLQPFAASKGAVTVMLSQQGEYARVVAVSLSTVDLQKVTAAIDGLLLAVE